MQVWEYTIVDTKGGSDEILRRLNELGKKHFRIVPVSSPLIPFLLMERVEESETVKYPDANNGSPQKTPPS